MPLLFLIPFFALFLSACGGHAGAYVIEPAPVWVPQPVATAQATATAVAVSPVETPVIAKAKGRAKKVLTDTPTATATETPTATVTPTHAIGLYWVPLQDKRRDPQIHTGRSTYESVFIEAAGSTLLAAAWHPRPYGDMAYLVHRQLSYALASSGYRLLGADLPVADEKQALLDAKQAGAQVLVSGQFKRLVVGKKGADNVIGTNFTGTDFTLYWELTLRLVAVDTGQLIKERQLNLTRNFFDPKMLGSEDRDTYPRYFATGLPDLALQVAGDLDLRQAAGLPTFTATPTKTATPEVFAPKTGDAPTPVPTTTPDAGPYWINPKSGERMDPDWKFDPKDGTPRDKFILRQQTTPTAKRVTEFK